VIDGAGVWTVVDGDPVAMRRGDLLLTASWRWHEHHNTADAPMVWLDGLDIPLVAALDAGFFEFGADELTDRSTPDRSQSEQLWAHPGLRPVAAADAPTSPLMAYRWEHTDAALAAQLDLAVAGRAGAGAVAPGHAAVRFTNPTNGRDALRTMRMEMHRLLGGTTTAAHRVVGSSVWQVFAGRGTFVLDGVTVAVDAGDVVAVPSWCETTITASTALDLFTFSDAPVYEALGLDEPLAST
jgi:gentisate 1,2-dioxygenase